MSSDTGQASEIRRALVDPVQVCDRLGLARGARRQSTGLTIRCPAHAEKTPSCSVTLGPDGTIRVRCFGCDWGTDVLGLVAAARGLDARRDFRAVLAAAADIGGLRQLADIQRPALRVVPPLPVPVPEREFPPAHEVAALWEDARPVNRVIRCGEALASRGLFPDADLAHALWRAPAARWARYQGSSWFETGHCVLLPTFDASGAMRSVRAWQIESGAAGPKRLPPAGYRATELVLANGPALALLRTRAAPARLLIAEGEPDFLSLCQRYVGVAVVGVFSGSWSAAFAERVPLGSLVTIRTHQDTAGDRYARAIGETLIGRALIKRGGS